MEKQELQQSIAEFERNRNQLLGISSQKQQLQFQSTALNSAIEELEKTQEKKAYKAVANIMVLCDVKDLKKEISEQKETADLRVKTLQKQEDALVEKLNKLKSRIEGEASSSSAQNSGEETKAFPSKPEKQGRKNSS